MKLTHPGTKVYYTIENLFDVYAMHAVNTLRLRFDPHISKLNAEHNYYYYYYYARVCTLPEMFCV